MIRPVASGRLFSVYNSSSSETDTQEQDAIARLESARRAMLIVQTKLNKTRAENGGIADTESDPTQLQGELRSTREQYDEARAALAELRSRRQGSASKRATEHGQMPLQSYLEKRAFAREFPDDAQRLRTYQIYNNRGDKTVFSASSLEFIGSTVDMRI